MADFIVTTLDDVVDAGDGVLSLREALALANGNAESDDITFAAALSGGTLFLTSGQQLEITTGGITIDGDIDGNGTPDITIDADSGPLANDAASRVFRISNGGFDPTTIAAALNGLVIQDGHTSEGAGIWVGPGDVLTLTNATVSGNSADVNGGGVFGFSINAITLTNATVTGNSAALNGGGISNNNGGGNNGSSSITLTNSIVAGNAAGGAGDDLVGGTAPSDLEFIGGNIIGSAPANFTTVTGTYILINGANQAALEAVFADVANDPNTGVLSGVLADNGGPGRRLPSRAAA